MQASREGAKKTRAKIFFFAVLRANSLLATLCRAHE
jgi:hypothetical protein